MKVAESNWKDAYDSVEDEVEKVVKLNNENRLLAKSKKDREIKKLQEEIDKHKSQLNQFLRLTKESRIKVIVKDKYTQSVTRQVVTMSIKNNYLNFQMWFDVFHSKDNKLGITGFTCVIQYKFKDFSSANLSSVGSKTSLWMPGGKNKCKPEESFDGMDLFPHFVYIFNDNVNKKKFVAKLVDLQVSIEKLVLMKKN